MNKSNEILLPKLIPMFDLYPSKAINRNIEVYDKKGNIIGYISLKSSDYATMNLLFKDSIVSASEVYDSNNNKSIIKYSISSIDDNRKIDGTMVIYPDYYSDSLSIFNNISIYNNGKFIGKCIFSTTNNKFYIYDKEKNIKISYKNGRYSYANRPGYVFVSLEDDTLYYRVETPIDGKDTSYVSGGYGADALKKTSLNDNDLYCEIKRLVPGNSSSVSDIKKYFDLFDSELFERMVSLSILYESNDAIKGVLDINDDSLSEKGRVLRKKKKN